MFLHACEKHGIIPFFFVIDIIIRDIYTLERQPGEPSIYSLCPIVDEV